MSKELKTLLHILMTVALACGFLHHLIPPEMYNFERLHIFLFNLCCGGTLLIHFTENTGKLSMQGRFFFFLSLLFAVSAFLQCYALTLLLPLLLACIVERVRIASFGSFLPVALFSSSESIARKFHQAALLCLSIGLFMSSPVILNDQYGHWFVLEKLKLDTFFLGFSFPLSLISMSVIFSLMRGEGTLMFNFWKEWAFWIINLGVIIFFFFILAQLYLPQVAIALILFFAVLLILYLYYYYGLQVQQKAFLTSGIFFLLCTSITGIVYIFFVFSEGYDHLRLLPLLRLHAFTALYGWNLSGLAVICRRGDFPIKLHSRRIIGFHWLTIAIFCPLGYFYAPCAFVAVFAYFWLLRLFFFNDGSIDAQIVAYGRQNFRERV